MSDRLEIGGWFGATWARHAEGREVDATILNGTVTLAFSDLLKEGSLGGIVVGVPPKLTDIGNGNSDSDTSLHIEAFYRLQISDSIYINPGFVAITNSDHNSNNDTIWTTTLRTTFKF